MLFLITLAFLLSSVFSTQICTSVEYSGVVYETDGLWNPTQTVYKYSYNLTIAQNTGNLTVPNILQVSNFAEWSSNSSIYYRNSTFGFVVPTADGTADHTVGCPLFDGSCVAASPNGKAYSRLGLTFLAVMDTTHIFVENGGIYDGLNGTVEQNSCLTGKSDTINSQHYYKYNQTACCTQYTDFNNTDIPPPDGYGTKCSDDAKLAWLDIVLVLDVSNVMTKLDQLSASLSTIMQGLTIGQNSDHTTRIGIITFGTDVNIVQQLKDTTTEDAFEDVLFDISINPNDPGGNMEAALNQSFNHILSQRTYRKPLILLSSAAYNAAGFKDVNATANSIKENGIQIMVINYAESDLVLTNALKSLASDGYYYVSSQDDLQPSVFFGLTQINCYCSPTTIQLSLYNPQYLNYTKYSDCFLGVINPASPTIANKHVCKLPGSLVSLTSQEKFDFIIDNFFTRNNPLFGEKKFSIGFHKSASDGIWKWWGYNGTEVAYDNFPPLANPPADGDNYGYMWNDYGFHWALQTGYNTALKYICQFPACDAANVCKD